MLPKCKLCEWLGICCIGAALSVHCPISSHDDKYAYMRDQPHTHEESRVPQYHPGEVDIAVASTVNFSGEISFNFYDMTGNGDSTLDE